MERRPNLDNSEDGLTRRELLKTALGVGATAVVGAGIAKVAGDAYEKDRDFSAEQLHFGKGVIVGKNEIQKSVTLTDPVTMVPAGSDYYLKIRIDGKEDTIKVTQDQFRAHEENDAVDVRYGIRDSSEIKILAVK